MPSLGIQHGRSVQRTIEAIHHRRRNQDKPVLKFLPLGCQSDPWLLGCAQGAPQLITVIEASVTGATTRFGAFADSSERSKSRLLYRYCLREVARQRVQYQSPA